MADRPDADLSDGVVWEGHALADEDKAVHWAHLAVDLGPSRGAEGDDIDSLLAGYYISGVADMENHYCHAGVDGDIDPSENFLDVDFPASVGDSHMDDLEVVAFFRGPVGGAVDEKQVEVVA